MATRETIIKVQLENQDAVRQLGKWEAELIGVRKETTALTAEIRKNNGATPEQTRRLGELRSAAKNLSGNIRELSNQTSGLTAAGLRFRDKMAGAFKQSLTTLGGQFLTVTGAVLGLKQVFDNVVGIIADFDKAQSRLAGILGTTKDGMAALTEQAKQLGATTAFTASQVADAQTELAKLGFTQNEILASTPALLDLARGAGADISQAAEIAAGTLNAFGLGAEETTRLADVMAKSFSSTALDIDKFTFAMRVVGPVAKNAGLSIEETTALIGVLADNNIRAETSGTGLRNILGKLAKTGMTFEEAMTEINTSTDKTKTAIDLFGLEASTVAIVLAENTTKTNELTEAFGRAGGAAKQLATDMDDNLIGDKLKLTSAWEGFVLSVDSGSGTISKSLRAITTALADILGYFTTLNSTDLLGTGGTGKGSVVAAEQATKNYRAELERLIGTEAEALGWKSKEEGIRVALLKLSDNEINAMRERARVTVERASKEGVAEETLLRVRERIAAIDAKIAGARDAREKSQLFAQNAAKRAELTILLTQLEKGRTEAEGKATAAIDEKAEADRKANEAAEEAAKATRRQSAAVRVLTDDINDLNKAQQDTYDPTSTPMIDDMFGTQPDTYDPTSTPMIDAMFGTDALIDYEEARAGIRNEYAQQELQDAANLSNALQAIMNAGFQRRIQDQVNNTMALEEKLRQASTAAERAELESQIKQSKKQEAILQEQREKMKAFAIAGALINTYMAANQVLADATNFTPIGKFLAMASVIATGLANVAQIRGFASGGVVSQSDGPRYTKNKGDSVLISAAPGEVVMTEEQQRRANRAAGFNIFRAAKVPGFAAGGTVSEYRFRKGTGGMTTGPRPSPAELNATRNAMTAMQTPIYVAVDEINRVQGRVARIQERATL